MEGLPAGYIKNGTDVNGNAIEGTPGKQNSVSTLINKGQDIINSDFTLSPEDSYYISTGNFVDASSTLIISPGVEIRFDKESTALEVEGKLVISGTPENPVVIKGFPTTRYNIYKGGIEINGPTASAIIQNARIQKTDGLAVDGGATLDVFNTEFIANDDAVVIYNGSATISSSTVRNTTGEWGGSIAVYNGSFLDISSKTINLENADGTDGIGIYDSTAIISNVSIKNTGDDGIGIYDSAASISNVTIENTGDDGIGVYDGVVSIASTTIRNTGRDGIGLFDSISTISDTRIEEGEENGIVIYKGITTIASTTVSGYTKNKCSPYGDGISTWCNMGSGILVEDPLEPVMITNSEIMGNTAGIYVDEASSVILDDVSVHDNVKNILVCETSAVCSKQ